MRSLPPLTLLSLLCLLACESDGKAAAHDTLAAQPVPGSVDSIFPREESIRRFRLDLPEVTALTGGASSRRQLEQRFLTALAARDTATLASLALTRAEFAWLYYPTVPSGMSETGLRPELMWLLLESNSHKGLRVILDKLGGAPVPYTFSGCAEPTTEGPNRLWFPCTFVQLRGTDTLRARLFGPILERGGVYKFVGLANTLD